MLGSSRLRAVLSAVVLVCLACGTGLADENWVKDVRAGAERGDAFAQTTLGVCYELGEGVGKDEKAAFKWYEKAAGQGWIGGMVRLGKCYASGTAVPADPAMAVKLWTAALAIPVAPASVQQTHQHEARTALARALRLGIGVEKNVDEAMKMAGPAAEWGLPEAEYELGLCFLQAANPDRGKAREYLVRARDGGFEEAGKALAENRLL